MVRVEVIHIEGAVFSGEAEFVSVPGREGSIGILRGHAPLLTTLVAGVVCVKPADGSEEVRIYVTGGFVEILPDLVSVLADAAVRIDGLDEASAQRARLEAQNRLQQQLAEVSYEAGHAALLKSMPRRF